MVCDRRGRDRGQSVRQRAQATCTGHDQGHRRNVQRRVLRHARQSHFYRGWVQPALSSETQWPHADRRGELLRGSRRAARRSGLMAMQMNLERIVANLVEKIERRFYGKYRGTVVDNQDPAKLGRLKLKVPSVLGKDVVSGWALPCAPYGGVADQGVLFIPDVGAGVWAEFEEGDLEFPIWAGTFWCQPNGDSELPKPNKAADGSEESSVQDPPTSKIIKTAKGHTLQFEDADG